MEHIVLFRESVHYCIIAHFYYVPLCLVITRWLYCFRPCLDHPWTSPWSHPVDSLQLCRRLKQYANFTASYDFISTGQCSGQCSGQRAMIEFTMNARDFQLIVCRVPAIQVSLIFEMIIHKCEYSPKLLNRLNGVCHTIMGSH